MESKGTTSEGGRVMGYAVQDMNAREPGALAYILTGARGASYGLLRYRNRPGLMFVVRNSSGTVCGLKGNYTFSDESGSLVAVS